jgi:hypothetical protein
MQKSKRNHWVAQAYLRYFAAGPDRTRIWRLGNDCGEPELKRIDKVAVRFYLYAPRDETGARDYSFEHQLASLESIVGDRFWHEVAGGRVDLCSESIRKGLGLWTAVTLLRSPRMLEFTKHLHRQFVTFYSSLADLPDQVEINGRWMDLDPSNWPSYRDADDDAVQRMWLSQIKSATWLAKMMIPMRWGFLFTERPVFITTDNPVTVLHPSLKFRGLKNADSTLIFPLSPTRVLFMDNRHSEPDGQYYEIKDPASLNGLLWRDAIEYMFSPRHPDEVCKEILESHERMGFAA